ncbi:MAG: hypothetical protein QW667_01695 [Candidatus Bathyarchaeia archaeon]
MIFVNLYTFYFPLSKLFPALIRYFLPKSFLLKTVASKIEAMYENFDAILVDSGRSALYNFLIYAKNMNQVKSACEVLIPNYICNVVDKAVVKSNLIPVRYETDEFFRPVIKDVIAKVSDKTLAVIFAPIFGSYDNVFIRTTNLVKKRKEEVLIIFDNAQCIDLKPPSKTDAVILSFNNKDIWGVMGGALLLKRKKFNLRVDPEKLSFYQELLYLFEFFKRICKIMRKESLSLISKLNTWHFEHSTCSRFPYTLNKNAISKISLIFALHGLNELEKYKERRKENYEAFKKWCRTFKNVKIIETKNVSTSPFIPLIVIGNVQETLSTFSNFRVQVKMPYAVDENPNLSLKKNIIAIPNNPNFDYSEIFLSSKP